MPERFEPKKVNRAMNAELVGKTKLTMRPELVTDLNIVLSKEQIENIIHGLLTADDFTGGQVAIAGDYCCVDASVGSSVAGPFSSVGSAVSCDPGLRPDIARVNQKLTAEGVRVNVMLPQNLKIR